MCHFDFDAWSDGTDGDTIVLTMADCTQGVMGQDIEVRDIQVWIIEGQKVCFDSHNF